LLSDDYLEYKKGHIINTGGSIWGLDFVPKLNDTDPTTQYIAAAGYRGSIDEHYYMNEVQETGSYKNYIQIWKCKLSTKEEPEDPELVMCLFHSFGVIHDMKWCPYGAYQQVCMHSINLLHAFNTVEIEIGECVKRSTTKARYFELCQW
jgi:hypothetical protein